MKFYDFVIAGAGCSGLSLATSLAKANTKHSILLIDKNIHTNQDKTWCFWDTLNSSALPYTTTVWQNLTFYSDNYEKKEKILPFNYVGVKSGDFYKYSYDVLKNAKNIDIVEESIERIYGLESGACIETKTQKFHCHFLFNSTSITADQSKSHSSYSALKQHFQGWLVKTEKPVFEKNTATFMDFRTEQHQEVRFFYVLPYSEREALIEYTIFSKQLLADEAYDEQIEKYIQEKLQIENFTIIEKEKGVIPMEFIQPDTTHNHIIPIGIVGGALKPSTGFAFFLIQKQVDQIIKSILSDNLPLFKKKIQNRFSFYDTILLHLLQKKEINKSAIFISLFKGNNIGTILTFLSEKTGIFGEMKIFSTLPVKVFIGALIEIYWPRRIKDKSYSPIYQTIR
jgi:lycopene beta-cyclase